MRYKFNKTFGTVAIGGLICALAACSDAWDNHYGEAQQEGLGRTSLMQMIDANPRLSDFARVLRATHLYNNMHATPVTYAQMLDADQTLTVWAPVNGSFNVDSLMELCLTAQGDSTVGRHFVGNHIAHHLHNMNSATAGEVKMLNDKLLPLTANALYNAQVLDDDVRNMPASNGLLNVVADDAQYTYNVYEGITSLPQYAHMGTFLKGFETSKLDEEHSIVASIEDGQKVYSDSVMTQENILFRTFDVINHEDSSFVMLAPTVEMWEQAYQQALPYFNYGSMPKADSIGNYWVNMSLMQDLVYNRNAQHSLADSLVTTSFDARDWPHHVYYRPQSAGGYLDPANFSSIMACSNGYIYNLAQWPFTREQLYFQPVITEGENQAILVQSKDCTLNYRTVEADSVSGNGYLDIVPKSSTSNWTATFEVKNHLSATYDIYAVILPKTVYNVFSRDVKPNKFKATVNYVDVDGSKKSIDFDTEMSNSGRTVDTIAIGRVKLPVCNYRQTDATVSIQLKCSITNRQTTYSREMYLDCLYLKPVE